MKRDRLQCSICRAYVERIEHDVDAEHASSPQAHGILARGGAPMVTRMMTHSSEEAPMTHTESVRRFLEAAASGADEAVAAAARAALAPPNVDDEDNEVEEGEEENEDEEEEEDDDEEDDEGSVADARARLEAAVRWRDQSALEEAISAAVWAQDWTLTGRLPNSGLDDGLVAARSVLSELRAAYPIDGAGHASVAEGMLMLAENAFHGCVSLHSVSLPTTLQHIGWRAFCLYDHQLPPHQQPGCRAGAGLTSADLSACTRLTIIGASAFKGCASLVSVTLPESLVSIGASAFEGCRKLSALALPESITAVEQRAFADCKRLTTVCVPRAWLRFGRKFERGGPAASAFVGCECLSRILLPDGQQLGIAGACSRVGVAGAVITALLDGWTLATQLLAPAVDRAIAKLLLLHSTRSHATPGQRTSWSGLLVGAALGAQTRAFATAVRPPSIDVLLLPNEAHDGHVKLAANLRQLVLPHAPLPGGLPRICVVGELTDVQVADARALGLAHMSSEELRRRFEIAGGVNDDPSRNMRFRTLLLREFDHLIAAGGCLSLLVRMLRCPLSRVGYWPSELQSDDSLREMARSLRCCPSNIPRLRGHKVHQMCFAIGHVGMARDALRANALAACAFLESHAMRSNKLAYSLCLRLRWDGHAHVLLPYDEGAMGWAEHKIPRAMGREWDGMGWSVSVYRRVGSDIASRAEHADADLRYHRGQFMQAPQRV